MEVFNTNDAGKLNAAREIISSHTPSEVQQILTWCEPEMAVVIRALLARHGVRRTAPQPEPRRRQAWPGRPGYQRERL